VQHTKIFKNFTNSWLFLISIKVSGLKTLDSYIEELISEKNLPF
jgi:hypothetical protein